MLDELDYKIIEMLKNNAKLPLKEIGEQIHLTPQGVSNRISRLQNLGVITQYTIHTNDVLLGLHVIAYVTVYMKTNAHDQFKKWVTSNSSIIEAHRISGEGCYLLKVHTASQEELLGMLDEILQYGNYKVNSSLAKIK